MEPKARVDRAEQARATGNDTRWRVGKDEGISHAYSRKYSRFVRLRLLGFKTPYFRNVAVKKDTQSFFTAPLPTSLSSGKKESVNVSYNIVDRSRAKGANEKGRSYDLPFRWAYSIKMQLHIFSKVWHCIVMFAHFAAMRGILYFILSYQSLFGAFPQRWHPLPVQ